MTKLFKNSKSVLSIALAFAVLAVSLFTGVVINTEAACASSEGTTLYWDGATATQPTQTDDDGNTLITSAEELAYITSNAVTGNYKIADGISNIVLQKEEDDNGIMQLSSQSDVEAYFENDKNSKTFWPNNYDYNNPTEKAFGGTFDGNGATIYGLYGTSGNNSLFGAVGSTAVIKNLTVKNCYLSGSNHGAVVSSRVVDSAGITYSNIEISNCRMEVSNVGNNNVGLLVGTFGSNANVTINNLLVYGCEIYCTADSKVYTCLSGYTSTNNAATGIKNSVILDCSVTRRSKFDTNYNYALSNHVVENVYSSYADDSVNTKITIINREDALGDAAIANMPNLDWSVWMANPNGYPELAAMHKGAAPTDNNNGTHSVTCECGVYGAPVGHSFVDGVCACGAELNCANKKTIYWDGTVATGFSSTGSGDSAEDPIIINTAAELAYLVKNASIRDYSTGVEGGVATVADKYYKIADGIGAIVLQPKAYADEIMALNSAADVKNYFSDTSKTFIEWAGNEGWEQGSFAGTFDGNGVTIYGMYGNNPDMGNNGLFSTVDAGATFKNFTIKNAYLHTSRANYNVGAIACVSAGGQYDNNGYGVVWVDRCAVVNSYIRNDCDVAKRSGIMLGCLDESEAAYFDNCLVYGNDAAYGANDTPMAILGSARNSISPENATNIPEGLETVLASDNLYRSMVRNSIVIGATPYTVAAESYRVNDADSFVNVYTDAETQNVVRGDSTTVTYEENQIKKLSAIDGATIAAEAENLDWNNVWFAAGVPTFRSAHDDVLSAEPYAEDNYAGHVETCSCGLGGLVVKHDYVPGEEYYHCTVCGFDCYHDSDAHVTVTPVDGDCLTTTLIFGECDCGFTATIPEGSIPGHTFTYNEEVPSDCQTQGTAAYNYCPNCDKKYAADADKYAAFETALSDEDLMLALGEHVHAVDPDGVPVYLPTDAGHQKICGVCSEAYGDVEVHDGTPVDNGDGTHSITCTVAGCGYAEESAPHVFEDGDNVCDICGWICESHTWVDDGEPVELGWDATDDACKKQAQKCDICGIAGEDKLIEHTLSDWETPFFDRNKVPACASDGSHTESRYCTECYYNGGIMPSEKFSKTVTDPKTGHAFTEYEAAESTCTVPGNIEYKYCPNCNYSFAMDAAEDEAYENALEDSEYMLEVDLEAHKWVEYKAKDATCEESGYAEDHKYCTDCYVFAIGDEMTDIILDYSKFYEEEWDENWNSTPIGIGAIAGKEIQAVEDATWAEFVKEKFNIEVPVEPGDDATEEDWDAYYAALNEYYSVVYSDMSWQEEWAALWLPTADAMWQEAYHAYYVAEAAALEENPVDLVIPATGHDIVKVDEVAATYDKEGTKAHYACENCDKLFSDAEGTIEVTEEDLVIAKLVKEEENKPSTDDKTEDKTENKAEGDKSDKSPATGESVASVAAVAALMGAAFVLVRKARKA